MRISFDLDDTLICYHTAVPLEPRLPWYLRMLAGHEPLRQGTPRLMRRLQERGWELFIYTTSYRHPRSVRRWLGFHGIRIAQVINQDIHERHFERVAASRPPTKHPKVFGIDLHVDDSHGVRVEGEIHGFEVVVIALEDLNWTENVWAAAEEALRRRTA